MLTGISIAVLLLVITLVVVLSVPVSLKFKFEQQHANNNHVELSWFFGMFSHRFLFQHEVAPSPKKTPNKSTHQAQATKGTGKTIFKLLLQQRFRHRFFQFISEIWRSTSKQNIQFHIRAGLGDPADTGRLWALIGPTSAAMAQIHPHAVVIEPDFIHTVLEINGSGTIRFIPLRLIFIALKLIFSPLMWQGLGQVRAANASC